MRMTQIGRCEGDLGRSSGARLENHLNRRCRSSLPWTIPEQPPASADNEPVPFFQQLGGRDSPGDAAESGTHENI